MTPRQSRISRGTPFPSFSRQGRSTDARGGSYFSGYNFFFLLGVFRICHAVPPLYTRDSGTSPNSGDAPRDKRGTAYPEPVGIRQYPCPVSAGHAGQEAGQSPKSCPAGGEVVRDKKGPVPVSVPVVGQGGGTWTF